MAVGKSKNLFQCILRKDVKILAVSRAYCLSLYLEREMVPWVMRINGGAAGGCLEEEVVVGEMPEGERVRRRGKEIS